MVDPPLHHPDRLSPTHRTLGPLGVHALGWNFTLGNRQDEFVSTSPAHRGHKSSAVETSILDIKGIAKCLVELSSLHRVEVTSRGWIENALRDRKDVVAVDHAGLWQSLVGANLDLRADAPNRPGDGCTGHAA